ncbi:helix-turn-helix domain-containing protein [Labrenzia sp. R4_2]|uniref:helix-turn-helix domain-containing protein n=1 Tax=Labrenzia sp. R4_2 TaxID=2821107 RepID=UPI001ADC1844|nr:helix-turn-helix domain-containing protein [Labrenzia sp. R4_2]MBO9420317.1 helix-turn-helix domain-containing protein [Labrenzia sp. R4_2]
MARRISAARVKSNRSYSVDEAAEIVGVTVQTIRAWLKQGLRCLNASRPTLILGADLKDFLKERTAKNALTLSVGEFKCFRCKAPKTPAFNLATYHPFCASQGRLQAFCPTCEGPMSRIVGSADLPRWLEICEIDGNGARDP